MNIEDGLNWETITAPNQAEVVEGLLVDWCPQSMMRSGGISEAHVTFTFNVDEHVSYGFEIPMERWQRLVVSVVQAQAYDKPFVMPTTPAIDAEVNDD